MTVTERLLKRAGSSSQALPIPVPMGRRDLPAFTRELGFTRGAEVGVWKGAFSAQLCEGNDSLHMLCVDPWMSYPAWLDTKNTMPPVEAARVMGEAYTEARARLKPLSATIVRKFSVEAAADVPDRSLDFVYIDGNHVFNAVLEDLKAWSPKVKPGGFIAGHDYRVFTNKPTIHVVAAVQAFTKSQDIAPWFVLNAERTPSFLWEAR